MSFSLKILGSNAAIAAHHRHQTSQVLTMMQVPFLIDCGEGTQLRLKKFKVKSQRIDHIFISHLHGDHYYGLMGLISSLHLYGRKKPLNIYAPPGLKEIISIQLKYSHSILNYEINYQEWTPGQSELLFENVNLTVHSFPLDHRIDCSGFLFQEKPKKRKIKKGLLEKNISPLTIITLKDGKDVLDENGKILLENKKYTDNPARQCSYAYCSDTRYDENIIPYIKGVDLLYHEATFKEDMKERADETYHSTTIQAGEIAKKAKVKKLLIGHYSTRYKELEPMLEETRTIFANTELALEGETITQE
ncbi:MAG: ribonuclease Z [Reichenbachiella sp.]|uniref:ribonuclease Z n=1 Tax=Reichenbachiella sp. TaxID=2184521 RepID=UPI0032649354